ncbi:MAG: hypothetical protein PHN72_03835 [Bacilli bacterium]|nr:hypothetical protein [Bacilli bacterium]
MKKLIALVLMTLFLFMPNVKAEEKIDVYLFYGNGCPHCTKEKTFLEEMKKEYTNIEVHEYETWYNEDNNTLATRVKNALGEKSEGVPYTVIGNTGFIGYNDNIGYQMENKIKKYDTSEENIVSKVLENPTQYDVLQKQEVKETDTKVEKKEESKVVVPFLGKVDAKTVSLPILAVVIGIVDGFNPCAMWVLLLLISMLLGMKNRKRMWALGITFLVTSALMYMLFMFSWLGFAKMVTSVTPIRIIIAVVALLAGLIHLSSYLNKEEDGCNVVKESKRKKMIQKIKKLTGERSFLLAILGIITLAITVNLVELACSAGLPLLFTQVLAMNSLSTPAYIFYILLYIFFFLIDDIIVFVIAMKTLELTGLSSKYSKYSHLIGGIIMLIIGILLLFNPGILMFNF